MPTINKRFLLKFVLVLAVLAGSLVGAHALQARRIPDALKRQADRAGDADKPDAAIRYLRQYLEFRPDDVDARERLAGLMRDRGGNPQALLFLYDKILRLDPDRHAVRREALKVCLRLGRFTDAEGHTEILLRAFPDDADLWQKQAAAQAAGQKTEAARQSYEKAVQLAPDDVTANQRLAQYLWHDLQKPADAKVVLDKLVAALPHDPEPYLTRAKFVLFNEAKDDPAGEKARTAARAGADPESPALADIRKALEVDPENADALLMLAEQYQKRRELAAARDCLADGMRLYPQDARMVRALSWLELNRGGIGSAVAVLEEGLERGRGDGFDLLVPLADLLVQLGETGRTEEIVRRIEAKAGPATRLQVKYLQGRLAMRRANWAEAADLLAALRDDAVNLPGLETQANLLLAACYQHQGDAEREQSTLRLICNKDQGHLAAHVALGQSFLNAGRVAEAVAEYETAVKSPFAGGPAHATLIRLKAARLRSSPNGGDPREWDAVERECASAAVARAFGPASADPVLLLAEVAAARGDLGKAVGLLRAEAGRRPGEPRVWVALADAAADVAGVSAGISVLDEAQAAAGDGPDLRLARAGLCAKDPARLRPLAPLGDQIDTWPDPDQLRLLYGLAEVYDRVGDDAGVVRTYRRIAARRPADVAVWEALCERAASSGDVAAAEAAAATAAKLDPAGKSAALCRAWVALRDARPDELAAARDQLAKHLGAAPDRADACVALGRLAAKLGDAAASRQLFERATRLEPTRFTPARALLAHLAEDPDPAPLAARLGRYTRDYRWAGDPLRRVASAALRTAPPDARTRLTDAVRPVAAAQRNGLGWLGDTLLAAGRRADALACYEQAAAAPAATPDDWLRYALRTAEGGDPAAAGRAMAAAREKLPPPFFFPIAAEFADAAACPKGWAPDLKSPAEVRTFAQARLALKLSRYQRAEAADLLEAYLKNDDLPAADAAWGRRNLAMLLVIRGTAADRTRAMTLLAADADPAGVTPDELRSTAAMYAALARYLDGPDRQKVLSRATGSLESLAKATNSPRDWFLLAQLYRATGTRESHMAGVAVMNMLLDKDAREAKNTPNLDYVLYGLQELMEANVLEPAAAFAQTLTQSYPTEFRAVAAVARYECKAGRPDKALALAEGYTRTADATAGDLPAKSARAAELLDELARLPEVRRTDAGRRMTKAAVDRYEALAATRPEAVIASAGLLAADDRGADAFALIEKHARSLSARLKAAAGIAALRAGGASEAQFGTVRRWLDAAAAEEPGAVALQLLDGEFWSLKQDFAAAERAYSAVLSSDPRNVVALNNLAWLLAPRPDQSARAMELVERAVAEVGLTGELLDTRARVRIAAKQFDMAERDLLQALTQDKTPLRLFHLALTRDAQSPPRKTEARDAFAKAKAGGLAPSAVHPADLPAYQVLDADQRTTQQRTN